jgi:hypothetical protein
MLPCRVTCAGRGAGEQGVVGASLEGRGEVGWHGVTLGLPSGYRARDAFPRQKGAWLPRPTCAQSALWTGSNMHIEHNFQLQLRVCAFKHVLWS